MFVVFAKVVVLLMWVVENPGELGIFLVMELPIHLEKGLQRRKDTYSSINCMLITNFIILKKCIIVYMIRTGKSLTYGVTDWRHIK